MEKKHRPPGQGAAGGYRVSLYNLRRPEHSNALSSRQGPEVLECINGHPRAELFAIGDIDGAAGNPPKPAELCDSGNVGIVHKPTLVGATNGPSLSLASGAEPSAIDGPENARRRSRSGENRLASRCHAERFGTGVGASLATEVMGTL